MADFSIVLPGNEKARILKWKITLDTKIGAGTVLGLYQPVNSNRTLKLKCTKVGTVKELVAKEGDLVKPGDSLVKVAMCTHNTVMKDMCADCGADLRQEGSLQVGQTKTAGASIAMVHSVPELVVSEQQAIELGKADEERQLKSRKLVLLVDLDQTLLHTTNDNIPPNLKDVYHFKLLHGRAVMWHHTKFRPGTERFLKNISQLYELHICSFGARMYAHTVAKFIDPEGKYFSHRILSRDECFSPNSKTANLKALFPCGDSMVCIIDDREDVWNYATNLVHVKPYTFFRGTADINAPRCLNKAGTEKGGKGEMTPARKARVVRVPKTKPQEEAKLPVMKNKRRSSKGEECDVTEREDVVGQEKLDQNTLKSENTEGTGNDKDEGNKTEVQTESGKTEPKDLKGESGIDKTELTDPKEESYIDIKEGKTDKTELTDPKEESSIDIKEGNTDKTEPNDPKQESSIDIKEGNIDETEPNDPKQESSIDIKEGNIDKTEPNDPKQESSIDIKEGNTDKTELIDRKEESDLNKTEPADLKEESVTDKTEQADNKCESGTDETAPADNKCEIGTDKTGVADNNGKSGMDKEEKPSNGVQSLQDMGKNSGSVVNDHTSNSVVASSAAEKMDVESTSEQSKEIPEDEEYEEMVEWEDDDDYLLYLENVLQRIHTAFYKVYDQLKKTAPGEMGADLKSIIPYVRKKVLKGCNIVFSGMFPTNQPPEKSRAYCLATSLGANIQPVLLAHDGDNDALATTHMVAARVGTSKVNAAKKFPGVHVVNANWLWCCSERWEAVDERLFPLTEQTSVSYSCNSPDVTKQQNSGSKRKTTDDNVTLAVYDPVTGKRIGNKKPKLDESKANGDATTSTIAFEEKVTMPSTSKREQRFSESYNPLYAFSKDDIASMDKEVEEIFDESESSDSESELRRKVLGRSGRDSSSSEADSLSGEFPRGWKQKRSKHCDEEKEEESDDENIHGVVDENSRDTSEDDDDFDESVGSVDEEMAAAVEKEFLSM